VPEEVRWLLAGSLAAALISITLITTTLQVRVEMPELYRTVDVVLIVCSVLCLGVGLTEWGAKGSLTAMALLLLAPIAVGILVWLKHTEPDTVGLD
jgi:hypothetical protein